jgi:hypothetical protein
MNTRTSLTRFSLHAMAAVALMLMATFAASPASARDGFGGGAHVGAFRGGGGYGGYRGGYGYRGGWRGYGYYGGWGWGWGWGGLGYGLFFAGLPLYYSTLWWDGVPYYYSAGDYYMWNGAVGQYETVRPPAGLLNQTAAAQPSATSLFVYPKNGQSADQQSRDRFECHTWARDQSGFDPTQPGSAAAPEAPPPGAAPPSAAAMAASPGKRQDYLRAETACLEGRGYSVR